MLVRTVDTLEMINQRFQHARYHFSLRRKKTHLKYIYILKIALVLIQAS